MAGWIGVDSLCEVVCGMRGLGEVIVWGTGNLQRHVSSVVALGRGVKQALSRDLAVRRIVRDWRALTGGAKVRDAARRTMIACSGGADSSALVLALASASENLVVAHVVHDMRSREDSLADRDAAKELANRAGLDFVEGSVTTRGVKGNTEAIARRYRYSELARLAKQHGCGTIVTAHHGDDQIETVLMRLLRGAGMRGMSGIASTRTVGGDVKLVRPMLTVTREDSLRVCKVASWQWQEDATNADRRLLRAMIRFDVVPALRQRCSAAALRAVEFGKMASEASQLARASAEELLRHAREGGNGFAWDRSQLRDTPTIVLGELLRVVHGRWRGEEGRDRLRWSNTVRVHSAIVDAGQHRRTFRIAGMEIVVDAGLVSMHPMEAAG